MTSTKFRVLLASVLLLVAFASNSYADISNAAVLFLRIAPGARAAGMGEAFVAIADDATATHWNPAGLGAYPLASTWIATNIPDEYRVVSRIAARKNGRADDYMGYEIWAITADGLARFDNKSWHDYEMFGTKTDETVQQIASRYFNIIDEKELEGIVTKIAVANNDGSYDDLVKLHDEILEAAPADYSLIESLTSGLDSVLVMYNLCRLNWDKVNQIRDSWRDGYKDSTLTEKELDRINIAAEKARMRYLPEELKIPYSALFAGELTSIASNGTVVMVGTTDGLYQYNGSNWRPYGDEDAMPSRNVLSMHPVGSNILIGTDKGIVNYNGLAIVALDASQPLPKGSVSAIGAASLTDIYVVMDSDLYHYDGQRWSNTFDYTVILDDTAERVTDGFAIYGTQAEKEKYQTKLEQARQAASGDSASTGMEPGEAVKLPYVAEIKGKVNDIYVDGTNKVWLATEYGLLYFDGTGWQLPGYTDFQVAEGQTLDDIVQLRFQRDKSFTEENIDVYKAQLKVVNDLGDEPLKAGQTIKIYANPNAYPVESIARVRDQIFFATLSGLVSFDGQRWSRAGFEGVDNGPVYDIYTLSGETWIVGHNKIVVRGRGKFQLTGMHVKWLPELASDLYYDFFSFVANKEGLGTFGGNVTFLSYGKIVRTDEQGTELGTFDSFDLAVTGSFGTSLTNKLKGGVSAKIIHSRLAEQGAGEEKGKGTSTGFAVDFGLLYQYSPRLTIGAAVTNLGWPMKYIDAAQSDDLPRNLAFGFAYKLKNSEYLDILATAEANKLLVGLNDGLSTELKEVIFNGGMEVTYLDLISGRIGYIYDQEGQIKTMTLGFGLSLIDLIQADLAYIPSNNDQALANTLRVSLTLTP